MLSRIITVTKCKAQINFMKIGFNTDKEAKELVKLCNGFNHQST